jgi:hypothetical protein
LKSALFNKICILRVFTRFFSKYTTHACGVNFHGPFITRPQNDRVHSTRHPRLQTPPGSPKDRIAWLIEQSGPYERLRNARVWCSTAHDDVCSLRKFVDFCGLISTDNSLEAYSDIITRLKLATTHTE